MSTSRPGGRRRLDSSVPPEYDVPVREPRIDSPRTARMVISLVIAGWALASLGSATAVVAVGAPDWIQRPSAALLMVVFAVALTHRVGGHMRIWTSIVGVLGVLTLTFETAGLLASSAGVTAVLAAVWAVMVTRPADSAVGVVREYLTALLVAVTGTFGVAAWNAPVTYQQFNLVVLAASLGLIIALVWGLGAGLHGLGRLHLAVLVGVAAVVLLLVAYSSFVRTHGSQFLVDLIGNAVIWMRQVFGGVPRPLEVFIGFPALVMGVAMRSRQREGWWVLVFAVLGTGVLTTSLVSPGAYPSYIGLSTLYSAVAGLILGLVVRRLVVQRPSSRASRAIEPVVRVEPGRLAGLK